ncbi:hypothetical protein [Mycolicibacterium fortuitum]|uniref:hypothetical protein n=1 Tax=Mycolicibacterium fortuitum TaxID=1766 RepID=UPI001490355B|nr:hypothetical protein [Mycolicibacterium fortuitum]
MSSSPISPEERDRFLKQIIANSPDAGITPAEQDKALREFIDMLITYAAITAWYRDDIRMGWGPNGMIYHFGHRQAS